MADSTKFGRRGIGRICGLDQVDYIITDAGAPVEAIRQLEEKRRENHHRRIAPHSFKPLNCRPVSQIQPKAER